MKATFPIVGSRMDWIGNAEGDVSEVSLPMGHDPSRVGQVGPVASCGQVGDIVLSLVKSRNLSWVGQVRPIESCGLVRDIDPSGSK